ncbi:glycosyltransferase [Vibrio sp. 1075]|uniref:glycosyltransferase n=1 Tax=Vibrio sp. 1075 TaxID=3074543 RepID=UPI0029657394|nr:glycosyltransferase [Vibrio sp. 1075]MDW2309488.1 glycosyltransferase [Vibrio sp. 1075]
MMNKRFVVVQNSLRTTLIFRKSYLEKLRKFGTVVVIAPNDCDSSKRELSNLGVEVRNFPNFKDGLLGLLMKIFHLNYLIIRERIFHKNVSFICHFVSTFLMSFFSIVPLNNHLIVYVEGLGSIFQTRPKLTKLLSKLLKLKGITRFFCNRSERDLLGMNSDTVTNGIGIDLDHFKPNKFQPADVKCGNYFVLGFVGRLIDDKGINDAIEVFRRLRRKSSSKIKMIVVGDIYPQNPSSISLDDLENLKYEFSGDLEFISFTRDVKFYYEQMDVLLLPSRREGFPVCAMEASAMGIPTVGYHVSGMEDAIIDGINGYLATPFNVDELMNQTNKLLDVVVLKDFKVSSTLYAQQNFSSSDKDNILIRKLLELSC